MRYLGIDFGLRRIGLAVSEHGEFANPWKVIEVSGLKDAKEKITQIITEEGFEKVIVGLPEGKIGKTVLGFIRFLKQKDFNVKSADETLSTKKAMSHMIELNISKNRRRVSDDYSAAIILQNYLDSL